MAFVCFADGGGQWRITGHVPAHLWQVDDLRWSFSCIDHGLETIHVGVYLSHARCIDPDPTFLVPRLFTPLNSPTDLHNKAQKLVSGIVDISQNPIRESCQA